MTLIKHYITLI